jgi:hypothetical protein
MTDFPVTLTLTSPPTRGPNVKTAQRHLNTNRYGDFLAGAIDSQYGVVTGAAAYRAKFLLGFPTDLVNHSYGPTLDNILVGDAKLPAKWQARRPARKKAMADKDQQIGPKAVLRARTKLGVREVGDNDVEFCDWYGMRGPWCAMFVTWCHDPYSVAFARGNTYAYVPFMSGDAVNHRNHLMAVGTPRHGDVIAFDWDGGVPDHTGMFLEWTVGQGFRSIEGNTGSPGQVMIRDRSRSQVEAWIRVLR